MKYDWVKCGYVMKGKIIIPDEALCMAYPTTPDHPQYGNPNPDPPKPIVTPDPPPEEEKDGRS